MKNYIVLNIVSYISPIPNLIPEEVKEGSHHAAFILSLKCFVMKKSIEAPAKPVQEKSSRKTSSSNSEKEKIFPFRKPVVPVTPAIRPILPNDHDPLDDELPIPGRTDHNSGRTTPTEEPW